ncbi:hypothetical protein DMENIID0001_124080 [Sergentomyia squamirostris]
MFTIMKSADMVKRWKILVSLPYVLHKISLAHSGSCAKRTLAVRVDSHHHLNCDHTIEHIAKYIAPKEAAPPLSTYTLAGLVDKNSKFLASHFQANTFNGIRLFSHTKLAGKLCVDKLMRDEKGTS